MDFALTVIMLLPVGTALSSLGPISLYVKESQRESD